MKHIVGINGEANYYLVNREGGIVGFDNCVGDLGAGHH